ncbi:MATE family efflux transporter [Nonomuraea sp. NPDC050536]|uniref:MATE family efflux transporter n=1 Tax=Nonomuraea sp. NPDC050536 TaxID=3364366 RepID=UPI0037CB54B6
MIRLALPVYVELLTAVVAVSVIDLLWVSGLGPEAIATVTVATTLEYLAYGVFLAIPFGLTVVVGRLDGRAPLGPAIRSGWALWAAASAVIVIPALLLRHVLALGTHAEGFLLISLGGLPVYFAQTVADGIVKGLGNTRIPMRNALICNALVIALDPLCIYGLGLGVNGAAWATLAARAITLAVSCRTLVRLTRPGAHNGSSAEATRPGARTTGHRSSAEAMLENAGNIMKAGLPMSGDFLARDIVGWLQTGLVASFGTAALAGFGIGQKIMLAGVMAFYALKQAAMIQTARSQASGSPLWLGLGAGVVVAAGLNLLAVPAAGLFTADPEAAVSYLRWMALYLVPFGGLIAVGGRMQADGRGGRLLAATLAGFAVQLPLAYLLSARIGVTGVWLASAAGAVVSLAGVLARRGSAPATAPGRGPRSTRTAAAPPSGR